MDTRVNRVAFLVAAVFVLQVFACTKRLDRDHDRVLVPDVPQDPEEPHECFTPCGECGRNVSVTLIVRNILQEPFFEHNITIEHPQRPLLYFLEEAADKDKVFRFTSTYFNKEWGHYISTINSLSDDNGGYWYIVEHETGNGLSEGASNYVPKHEEILVFNFTNGSH